MNGAFVYRETARLIKDGSTEQTITVWGTGAYQISRAGAPTTGGCFSADELGQLTARLTAAAMQTGNYPRCLAVPSRTTTVEISGHGSVVYEEPCGDRPDRPTMRGIDCARDLLFDRDGVKECLPDPDPTTEVACAMAGPMIYREGRRSAKPDVSDETISTIWRTGAYQIEHYGESSSTVTGCLSAHEVEELRSLLTEAELEPVTRRCTARPLFEATVQIAGAGAVQFQEKCGPEQPTKSTWRAIVRARDLLKQPARGTGRKR